MTIRPVGKVSLPIRPHTGLDVLSWARSVDQALRELSERKYEAVGTGKNEAIRIQHAPLVPKLTDSSGAGSYSVIVTQGYVCEIDSTAGATDAINIHEIANLTTDGVATAFAMEDGKAIAVKVPITPQGAIDTETGCTIEVVEDDQASTNPIPPSDDYPSGVDGTHYYILATLSVDAQGNAKLNYNLAGDNVVFRKQQESGLNGYIHVTRDNSGVGAGVFLRVESGKLTDIQDEYSDSTPPESWGDELISFHYVQTAGYYIAGPWF